jgi:hypothetical protein
MAERDSTLNLWGDEWTGEHTAVRERRQGEGALFAGVFPLL